LTIPSPETDEDSNEKSFLLILLSLSNDNN